jgi:predicted nucleotidyltransferase
MDIERKCKNLLGKLFRENDVNTTYLFGSYAKKNFGPLSDIDKSNVDIVILNENSSKIRDEDLRALQAFKEDYPESKAYLLYRGKERLFTN